jgi:hypothetical protein
MRTPSSPITVLIVSRESHLVACLSMPLSVLLLSLIGQILGFLIFVNAGQAQTDIFVRGSGKKYPIALPIMCSPQGELAQATSIPKAITKNLGSSGFFDVVDPKAYIETPGKCTETPTAFAFSDWSVIGAEGLVRGVIQQIVN